MTIHTPALHVRRKELEARIAELIDLLDLVDEDPDLEDNGDAEPILGWPENGPASLSVYGGHDDREMEDEIDEDGGDTEPNGDEGDYNGGESDAPIPIWGGMEDYQPIGTVVAARLTPVNSEEN